MEACYLEKSLVLKYKKTSCINISCWLSEYINIQIVTLTCSFDELINQYFAANIIFGQKFQSKMWC